MDLGKKKKKKKLVRGIRLRNSLNSDWIWQMFLFLFNTVIGKAMEFFWYL